MRHRRNTILNYKDPTEKGIVAKIRPDGRVPAKGILCATPTGRTTHREAVCNVPKASDKVVLGKEMRSIFCVCLPDVMLGADLDQIEARITAHYASLFDGGEYWRIIEETGDIHQYNADLIGQDRDTAKSFQYALVTIAHVKPIELRGSPSQDNPEPSCNGSTYKDVIGKAERN